jgi:hypothetical protein
MELWLGILNWILDNQGSILRVCLVDRANPPILISAEISKILVVWLPGYLLWALPDSPEKGLSALSGREAEIELRTWAGLTSPGKIPPRLAPGRNPTGVGDSRPHFPPTPLSLNSARAPHLDAGLRRQLLDAGRSSLASAAPASTPAGAPSPHLSRPRHDAGRSSLASPRPESTPPSLRTAMAS